MRAANVVTQRSSEAKLLVIDGGGTISHWERAEFVRLLHPGDLVIANDAATLPASLSGVHVPTDRRIEVRLAGRNSLAFQKIDQFSAILFGEGDFRLRTEDRATPPVVAPGDLLRLGPLRARIVSLMNHPRFVSLSFDGSPDEILKGLARHGRAIQYSHVTEPLALWDVWTPIAGPPVAYEPPSAGFILSWDILESMTARGIRFATVTHAAGISSTGDAELDALLPLDEPYRIPESTALAIANARARGGRVIAIGTTVVRALEHAAQLDGIVRAGENLATQRITASSRLRVVDVILSGTHEPGTSHYDLLRAFISDEILHRAIEELDARNYRTHEFGDSVFIERWKSNALSYNLN